MNKRANKSEAVPPESAGDPSQSRPRKIARPPAPRASGKRQSIGLLFGPLLFLAMLLLPSPPGMSVESQRVAAVALLMATLWISEAIPIPATSLLPIILFPMLGVMSTPDATASYANHLIFLFLGGFIIALAVQRWQLHRRIALHVIRSIGFSPQRLVLGFMAATALLSAFVSNTATTVIMMPIGLAVIHQTEAELKRNGDSAAKTKTSRLGLNIMLGIAYSASIGGIATLIGTPPNTVLAGYLSIAYGYEITFARWLLVGLPLTLLFLPLCWLWLTRIAYPIHKLELPQSGALIERELKEMGRMSRGERRTLIVFFLTALGWIFRPYLASFFPDPSMIKDATIAIAGAVALFFIPVDFKKKIFVMNWQWAEKLPWGVLILFGGGLSLARGFEVSGLAAWVVGQVGMLSGLPMPVIILGVATLIILLTEMTSNTATSTMLMPVLAGVAIGLGESPLLLLAPAAMAASCAFMLPVATPPNAIIFGSGYVTIPQMVRGGIGPNVIGVFLITLITYFALIPAFGIVLGELPSWAK